MDEIELLNRRAMLIHLDLSEEEISNVHWLYCKLLAPYADHEKEEIREKFIKENTSD